MELTVATYRTWVQRQRKVRTQLPSLDIEKIIGTKKAQQAYDRFKTQAMRRNLTNPAFTNL